MTMPQLKCGYYGKGGTMKFNKWIHEAVKESGYTRQEIADHVGVSRPAVDKWLAGKSYPKVAPLWNLCALLWPGAKKKKFDIAVVRIREES